MSLSNCDLLFFHNDDDDESSNLKLTTRCNQIECTAPLIICRADKEGRCRWGGKKSRRGSGRAGAGSGRKCVHVWNIQVLWKVGKIWGHQVDRWIGIVMAIYLPDKEKRECLLMTVIQKVFLEACCTFIALRIFNFAFLLV